MNLTYEYIADEFIYDGDSITDIGEAVNILNIQGEKATKYIHDSIVKKAYQIYKSQNEHLSITID